MELQKFSSQANPAILQQMKEISKKKGQKFQHTLEEAMQLYLEQENAQNPRPEIVAHAKASMERHAVLGKLLA